MSGDAKGNVAWWATGKLYKHNPGVNPNFILDGASGKDDIKEYFDFSKNPSSVNPSWNYVYSANNQPEAIDGFLYPGYYLPEDRAKRIVHLLDSRKNVRDEMKLLEKELKTENPDYWAKFGSKESELFSKYNKIFIIKYWSDSHLQGYVSIADISDLVLDIDDKATFIKTTGAQIYVLKSGKGPLKIEYETFSCPKLSSECLIQANGVTSLPTEDSSTSGRFIKFWLTPDAISKIDSAWLDFKSIKIGGMDGEINEP
jgi:hypothetical protein